MKVSMTMVVGLAVLIFAIGIGQAEAQHRGGKGKVAVAHAPKGGARPGAGKAHPAQHKAKTQHKAKGAMAKAAQKKAQHKASAKAKHDEKKKHTAKVKGKAKAKAKAGKLAKKAETKAPAKVATGGGPDHESIALLRAAHQRLHQADHDYAGHRIRAMEHVGSALGHLGSSAQAGVRSGTGRGTMPQPVSDAHLREARGHLEMIRNRIAAGPAAAKGHGAARGAVEAAIREIDIALSLR